MGITFKKYIEFLSFKLIIIIIIIIIIILYVLGYFNKTWNGRYE